MRMCFCFRGNWSEYEKGKKGGINFARDVNGSERFNFSETQEIKMMPEVMGAI